MAPVCTACRLTPLLLVMLFALPDLKDANSLRVYDRQTLLAIRSSYSNFFFIVWKPEIFLSTVPAWRSCFSLPLLCLGASPIEETSQTTRKGQWSTGENEGSLYTYWKRTPSYCDWIRPCQL